MRGVFPAVLVLALCCCLAWRPVLQEVLSFPHIINDTMPFFWRRQNDQDKLIKRPVHRPLATIILSILRNPTLAVANLLYSCRAKTPPQPAPDAVSVVCISDTHNSQFALPYGDVLIHAGDLTHSGSFEELQRAIAGISSQPHPVKVVVAGNHDTLLDTLYDSNQRCSSDVLDKQRQALDWGDIIYLQNTDRVVTCPNGRRLRIYGSPLSPKKGNWAFQYPRGENVWRDTIPQDVDILITHGPPRAHRDLGFGCVHLLQELRRAKPRLHVVGHVHEAAGIEYLPFDALQAAYEQIGLGTFGSVWTHFKVMFEFMKALFVSEPVEAQTVLVNAAMVGGLRGEKRREAILVLI